jgi:hypothetical protein
MPRAALPADKRRPIRACKQRHYSTLGIERQKRPSRLGEHDGSLMTGSMESVPQAIEDFGRTASPPVA